MDKSEAKRTKGRGKVVVGETGDADADDEMAVDLIRELPMGVIVKILSCLPTRDAVRTMTVSGFRHLWTHAYNLDFDLCEFDDSPSNFFGHGHDFGDEDDDLLMGKFRRFVLSVLANHRGPKIVKFRLSFSYMAAVYVYYDGEDEVTGAEISRFSDEVDSWIGFAVNKGVEILEVDLLSCQFSQDAEFKHCLPSSALRSESLTSLNLVKCDVGAGEVSMPNLRTLSLENVELGDDIIGKILAGCPSLESLTIKDCVDLEELNCYSRRLHMLMIEHGEESRLGVTCPYVRSLTISGEVEHMELKDVSGVHDVSIGFSHDDCYSIPDDYLKVWKILESICCARAVTMAPYSVQALAVSEMLNMSSSPNNWRCLVIETPLDKWQLPGIRSMLRSSHSLEVLCLCIVQEECLQREQVTWMKQFVFDEKDYWDSPDESFQLLHLEQSLKSIKVTGNAINLQILPLLQLLLRKATKLEQLAVEASLDDEPGSVEKWEEFTEKLCALPKASSRLAISQSLNLVEKPIH